MEEVDRRAVRERLVELTVDLVLCLRAQYLAGPDASPLRHWDQIQERLRAAARRCESPAEVATDVCRKLRLGAPSNSLSRSIDEMERFVGEKWADEWLELLEREYSRVIAQARLVAEARRMECKAKQAGEAV